MVSDGGSGKGAPPMTHRSLTERCDGSGRASAQPRKDGTRARACRARRVEIGPDDGSGKGAGRGARRCSTFERDGRQVVPEHALGGVGATCEVVGSALCVRFRDSALGARRGDGVFDSGRHHEIVRVILFRGLVRLIFFC